MIYLGLFGKKRGAREVAPLFIRLEKRGEQALLSLDYGERGGSKKGIERVVASYFFWGKGKIVVPPAKPMPTLMKRGE